MKFFKIKLNKNAWNFFSWECEYITEFAGWSWYMRSNSEGVDDIQFTSDNKVSWFGIIFMFSNLKISSILIMHHHTLKSHSTNSRLIWIANVQYSFLSALLSHSYSITIVDVVLINTWLFSHDMHFNIFAFPDTKIQFNFNLLASLVDKSESWID